MFFFKRFLTAAVLRVLRRDAQYADLKFGRSSPKFALEGTSDFEVIHGCHLSSFFYFEYFEASSFLLCGPGSFTAISYF